MEHELTNTRETILARLAAGERLKYLFFWGHTPRPDGRIGAPCLSQWWPARFSVDGVTYPSAEHYMMAEKARLFDDEEALARILVTPHPAEAKKLGRTVRRFEGEIWFAHRTGIVYHGNLEKFSQNQKLREFLISTGNRILVEASPQDRVWGIGVAAADPRAAVPARWQGQNLLGFALMDVRNTLRE